MRCDGCKHWKKDGHQQWEAETAGMGQCLGVIERWRITEPLLPIKWDEGYQEAAGKALREARAFVQDGSEYRAEMFTAPEFFCALFAPTPVSGDLAK